jgi:hypothetical protein
VWAKNWASPFRKVEKYSYLHLSLIKVKNRRSLAAYLFDDSAPPDNFCPLGDYL